jgi:hypothetical protein
MNVICQPILSLQVGQAIFCRLKQEINYSSLRSRCDGNFLGNKFTRRHEKIIRNRDECGCVDVRSSVYGARY